MFNRFSRQKAEKLAARLDQGDGEYDGMIARVRNALLTSSDMDDKACDRIIREARVRSLSSPERACKTHVRTASKRMVLLAAAALLVVIGGAGYAISSTVQSESPVSTVEASTAEAVPTPAYIPPGLKKVSDTADPVPGNTPPSIREEIESQGRVVAYQDQGELEPGKERRVEFQVADPNQSSIWNEHMGWWLPAPTWKETTINGKTVRYGVQEEHVTKNGKQYDTVWTRIEWTAGDRVIRVFAINVPPDEAVKMAQSVR